MSPPFTLKKKIIINCQREMQMGSSTSNFLGMYAKLVYGVQCSACGQPTHIKRVQQKGDMHVSCDDQPRKSEVWISEDWGRSRAA